MSSKLVFSLILGLGLLASPAVTHAALWDRTGMQRDMSVVAEGPVLVTPMRPTGGSDAGNWLRMDLSGDASDYLAENLVLDQEFSCLRSSDRSREALCTVWFNRAGDGRVAPPEHRDRWKLSDTVIGTAQVGRIQGSEELFWVEISSPALARWFNVPRSSDIECQAGRCAFVLSRFGAIGSLPPKNRDR